MAGRAGEGELLKAGEGRPACARHTMRHLPGTVAEWGDTGLRIRLL